jgi:hypothetical protein
MAIAKITCAIDGEDPVDVGWIDDDKLNVFFQCGSWGLADNASGPATLSITVTRTDGETYTRSQRVFVQ